MKVPAADFAMAPEGTVLLLQRKTLKICERGVWQTLGYVFYKGERRLQYGEQGKILQKRESLFVNI